MRANGVRERRLMINNEMYDTSERLSQTARGGFRDGNLIDYRYSEIVPESTKFQFKPRLNSTYIRANKENIRDNAQKDNPVWRNSQKQGSKGEPSSLYFKNRREMEKHRSEFSALVEREMNISREEKSRTSSVEPVSLSQTTNATLPQSGQYKESVRKEEKVTHGYSTMHSFHTTVPQNTSRVSRNNELEGNKSEIRELKVNMTLEIDKLRREQEEMQREQKREIIKLKGESTDQFIYKLKEKEEIIKALSTNVTKLDSQLEYERNNLLNAREDNLRAKVKYAEEIVNLQNKLDSTNKQRKEEVERQTLSRIQFFNGMSKETGTMRVTLSDRKTENEESYKEKTSKLYKIVKDRGEEIEKLKEQIIDIKAEERVKLHLLRNEKEMLHENLLASKKLKCIQMKETKELKREHEERKKEIEKIRKEVEGVKVENVRLKGENSVLLSQNNSIVSNSKRETVTHEHRAHEHRTANSYAGYRPSRYLGAKRLI